MTSDDVAFQIAEDFWGHTGTTSSECICTGMPFRDLTRGLHTTVLPFVLIEMRTTHHQYPSRSCGLAAVCTFAVGYILWVCWIHHVTGVWVYPLLEHLSPGVKIIFFAAVTVVINIFYLVGEVLNNYIWDTQKCIEEGKEKPKLD
ncbi:PREDICTED: androgen-induced gene 1 protein-like [Tauraco erythrolophus]|uniref:androgen-induced gene 1 protein-like n=1 Tax=Tauraco erythrolophus TaxID=121530 RepID=UPI000523693A|nr:PREDICTED: androgen-induced gene 1 protein-like [Tauraco erythrolophus]